MCDLALKHFYHRNVKALVNVNVMVCLQFRLNQDKTHLCLLFVKGGRGIEGRRHPTSVRPQSMTVLMSESPTLR